MPDITPIAPRGQIGTTFDLAWPPVYGLFALSAWAFALERLGPGFDFAENIAATLIMASLPARPLAWRIAASVATPLKWAFVIVGIGGAVILPAAATP